jgi:HEAT repeat protein
MTTLSESVAAYWKEQFDAFQLDDDEENFTDSAIKLRSTRVVKELLLFQLNRGLAELSVDDKQKQGDGSDNVSALLSDLFVDHYVPACFAVAHRDSTTAEELQTAKYCLEFVAAVAQELDAKTNDHVVVSGLMELAADASLALSDSVRAAACCLLGSLNTLVAGEALIPRLTDKAITVRAAAIDAAGHILESATIEENDGLLDALLWNVWHDPSVPNRVAAIQALPPTSPEVWDHVIARLRDVKEKVRVAAMGVLKS